MTRLLLAAILAGPSLGCSLLLRETTFRDPADAATTTPDAGSYDAGPTAAADSGHDASAGTDDGGPDATVGVDAGSPLCPEPSDDSIIGCATTTYIDAEGVHTLEPLDLSHYTVTAHIPDDSPAGFRVIDGTAGADGTVHVAGVPEGVAYYLRLHDPTDARYAYPTYYFTSARALDLGDVRLGRDDTPALVSTPIAVTVGGVAPVSSGSIGTICFNSGTIGPPLMPSGTSASTVYSGTGDWQHSQGEISFHDLLDYTRSGQFVDATRGDDIWVYQLGIDYLGSFRGGSPHRLARTVSILRAFSATGITMIPGETTTLTGDFAPSPLLTQIFRVDVPAVRSAFRDNNRYATESVHCALSANPGAAQGISFGILSSFLVPTLPSDSTFEISTSHVTPYRTDWPRVITCTMSHRRTAVIQGRFHGSDSYLVSHTAARADFTWSFGTRAPSNIRIAGRSGLEGGTVPFDGVRPIVMEWDPVPGVRRYAVRVVGSEEGAVAKFLTHQSQLVIPAELFAPNRFYVFRLYTIQTPDRYDEGRLVRLSPPLHSARVSTGWFRFSTTCGNGEVDPGEDCDPGGDTSTATCDADCTSVMCGDGFLNTVAGEVCDDGPQDGQQCDRTCRRPSCGDGYWNRSVEECDDGNADSGDGCSWQCTLETCGNGALEMFEDCDDGNRLPGDGCNGLCRRE